MYPTLMQMSATGRSVVRSRCLASESRNTLTVCANPAPVALVKSREVEDVDRPMCWATSINRNEVCKFSST